MATRFEFLLCGWEESYLRSAAEEALDEIGRLEAQLSIFRPTSDVSDINRRAAREWVIVEPVLYRLLRHAAELTADTAGAFDISVAPLMARYGLYESADVAGTAEPPVYGMHYLQFDDATRAVHFGRDGMAIDLGAIGKGYAIDLAVRVLREKEVPAALLHAGTSSVYAMGTPPDADDWLVGVGDPLDPERRLGTVRLRDAAFATSGSYGKVVEREGVKVGHLLDPRTGTPAEGVLSAAAICPSSTNADALSTAFAVLDVAATQCYCDSHPEVGAVLVREAAAGGSSSPRRECVLCGAADRYFSAVSEDAPEACT